MFGSEIGGGPEMIEASGAAPEPAATAKSVSSSISSAQTSPVFGLFVSVTSTHALPSNWSRRGGADRVAGSYGMQSGTGSPYSAVVLMS